MLAQVGATRYVDLTADETATTVVAGSVLLFNILGFNSSGSISYLQFFDALVADVTVGTTTPSFVIPLPAGGGYDTSYELPEAFRTGVVIACTATATGSGAPATNAVVKLGYTGG